MIDAVYVPEDGSQQLCISLGQLRGIMKNMKFESIGNAAKMARKDIQRGLMDEATNVWKRNNGYNTGIRVKQENSNSNSNRIDNNNSNDSNNNNNKNKRRQIPKFRGSSTTPKLEPASYVNIVKSTKGSKVSNETSNKFRSIPTIAQHIEHNRIGQQQLQQQQTKQKQKQKQKIQLQCQKAKMIIITTTTIHIPLDLNHLLK